VCSVVVVHGRLGAARQVFWSGLGVQQQAEVFMGRRSSAVRKSRFTLFLPDDTPEELVKQQEASGKGSIAEVVREAADIYVSLIRGRRKLGLAQADRDHHL